MLRSIKDLEFDHAMGKVSDKDFAEMGARFALVRAGLIVQLDAGTSYRQAIEAEIQRDRSRGERERYRPAAGRTKNGRETDGAVFSCCTPNDPDARFCKGCGYQLGDW